MLNKHPLSFIVWSCMLLLLQPGYCYATDTITVQLKWKHQFQFAGYYAAINQGYFHEEKLSVKLVAGSPHLSPAEEVLSGRAQYGVSSSEIISNHIKGDRLTVLGVILQHSPYILVTRRSSNIKKPSDLIGKKIMADERQGWTQIKAIFLKEGINPNLLKLEQHRWDYESLIQGQVDAMSAYSSFEPFMLRKLGFEPFQIRPADYGVDFYGDLFFSTTGYAANHADEVSKMRRAIFKGWQYAFEHAPEMADYILTLPGVKERGITKDVLLDEAGVLKKLAQPDLISIGHMNEGRWQTILNTYKQLGLSPDHVTLDGFLYNPNSDEYRHKFRYAYYAIMILFVFLLAFLLHNVHLKMVVNKRTRVLQETTDELMLSNTELEKFAYVTSHNLRAPVVNIRTLMKLYNKEDTADPDNAVIINKLDTTTQKLESTLQDLIKVISGKAKRDEAGVMISFEEQLNNIQASVCEMIEETKTSFITRFDVAGMVYSEKVICSIFQNLITNSIKYRIPGKPPVISISTTYEGEYVVLTYIDNGTGVDMERNGDKLFGLFQRFNINIEGSGIGLYIIKKQIETLGGSISAKSRPNEGITFTIYLKALPQLKY